MGKLYLCFHLKDISLFIPSYAQTSASISKACFQPRGLLGPAAPAAEHWLHRVNCLSVHLLIWKVPTQGLNSF